jgi:hypothetical protein
LVYYPPEAEEGPPEDETFPLKWRHYKILKDLFNRDIFERGMREVGPVENSVSLHWRACLPVRCPPLWDMPACALWLCFM